MDKRAQRETAATAAPASLFVPGLELSQLFFVEAVRPILDAEFPGLTYSAARIDSGSEVMGFDTQRSADHEWGPRLNLFVSPDDSRAFASDISTTLSHQLPKEFRGYPTHFVAPDGGPIGHMTLTDGPVHHRVGVSSVKSFLEQRLGFDPQRGISDLDWLSTPMQRLREVTSGAVFRRPRTAK